MSTDKKKLIRKMTMGKEARKKLFIDESRVWNLSVPTINGEKLISYMFGYFYTDRVTEKIYPNEITNFTSFTNSQKGNGMRRISSISPDIIAKAVFYNQNLAPSTILHIQPLNKIDLIEGRLAYLLVLRYYHDRRDTGFMKNLTYQGKVFSDKSNHINKRFCEFDRVLYIYVSTILRTFVLSESQINWNFPDKYSKTLGLSLRGFSFTFPDLSDSLKTLLEPSSDLINKETGTEEISSVPTQYLFFPKQKVIKDAIKN